MQPDLSIKIKNAYGRGWAVLAQELQSLQKSNSWVSHYNNFSEFIADVAAELKLSIRLIWRFRKAYDFYLEIAKSHNRYSPSHDIPEDISRHFSPDSLELLDRFRQVMPEDLFYSYCEDYLDDKISRENLRAEWKTFKKAIVGKIPRRRTSSNNKSNAPINISIQQKAVTLKLTRECLLAHIKPPLGMKEHEIDERICIPITAAQWNDLPLPGFDAICIEQQTLLTEPVVHGICLTNGDRVNIAEKLELATACDYFWLAGPKVDGITPDIGLIVVDGKTAEIRQTPTRQSDSLKKYSTIRYLLVKCQA